MLWSIRAGKSVWNPKSINRKAYRFDYRFEIGFYFNYLKLERMSFVTINITNRDYKIPDSTKFDSFYFSPLNSTWQQLFKISRRFCCFSLKCYWTKLIVCYLHSISICKYVGNWTYWMCISSLNNHRISQSFLWCTMKTASDLWLHFSSIAIS